MTWNFASRGFSKYIVSTPCPFTSRGSEWGCYPACWHPMEAMKPFFGEAMEQQPWWICFLWTLPENSIKSILNDKMVKTKEPPWSASQNRCFFSNQLKPSSPKMRLSKMYSSVGWSFLHWNGWGFHDWVSHFNLTIPHNNVEPLNQKWFSGYGTLHQLLWFCELFHSQRDWKVPSIFGHPSTHVVVCICWH